jgi:primosomal protein N'
MAVATADRRQQAREAARKARAMAAQIEAAAGIRSDAERKRADRAAAKDVTVPRLTDEARKRRVSLEKNDERWLRFFFPDPPFGFWYPFTNQQRAMVRAIGDAIKHGGDQAIAASRGEGKTQIARRLLLKYVLSGQVSFAVLFASTATDAIDSLTAIRSDIEESDLLLEYYPEVCAPVRALENTPNRAHYQTVTGKRHDTRESFTRIPSRFSAPIESMH